MTLKLPARQNLKVRLLSASQVLPHRSMQFNTAKGREPPSHRSFAGAQNPHAFQNCILKARTERCNWTYRTDGLVSDKMTKEQAVIYYSRHCITASVTTWLPARTRQPKTSGLALLVHWSVRQTLNRSVQFSYVALYAPLSCRLFSSSVAS